MNCKPPLILLCAVVFALSCGMVFAGESKELRILTFNIWNDGRHGTIEQIVNVIRASKADVVGLQEENRAAESIAKALGWNYIKKDGPVILSRYPIIGPTPNQKGAIIKHDSGRIFFVFNNHLMHIPYQPYQLLGIPYGKYPFLKTEAEAVAAAKKARGKRIADVLKDVAAIKDKEAAIFIMGDFNEPSHQDWTERAAKAKRHPIKVAYPATLALTEAGFADSYRTIYPDEMKFPGYTWTPRTKITDSTDHHDRIDFIFFRGGNVKLKSVKIIGPDSQGSDVVVKNYPSDHRALLSVFEIQ